MSVSREMSEMEIRVLNMIMNCATFDLPIQANEIRLETGLSKRKLEEVIESLRVNFGHPIVAKKMKPNGITCHEARKSDKLDLLLIVVRS